MKKVGEKRKRRSKTAEGKLCGEEYENSRKKKKKKNKKKKQRGRSE